MAIKSKTVKRKDRITARRKKAVPAKITALPKKFVVFRQADFLQWGCGKPDCDHSSELVHLRGVCHPDSATQVYYRFEKKTIMVTCSTCNLDIAEIAVG